MSSSWRFGAFLAVGVIAAMALPQSAFAFGALAIDSNHGSAYGFGHDYSTRRAAEHEALSECGSGCTIVVEFQRGCAAYSADQRAGSSVYGWVNNVSSESVAEAGAQAECARHGGRSCVVRVWSCE
jgi:hypothetical protein